MNKDVTMPSGAILHITASPFKDAKALYQALLEEAKTLKLDPEREADFNFFKDLFCTGFSSKKIEACLEKCFDRCTYDGKRITGDTFEPITAREDYMSVCFAVAEVNVSPFAKHLSSEYSRMLASLAPSRE